MYFIPVKVLQVETGIAKRLTPARLTRTFTGLAEWRSHI